jgi:AraC-like DNA-binding protein
MRIRRDLHFRPADAIVRQMPAPRMPRFSRSRQRLLTSPFTQSLGGQVRVGPLAAIPDLVQELGASPRRVFASAGVSLREFRQPDTRLEADRIARLLQEATWQTARPDFAMMAGLRFSMQGLGPIGELMQHSTTVGEALRSLVLHLHLHDLGAAPVLLSTDDCNTLLGYSVYRFGVQALDLVYDTSTGIVFRILEALCGPDFHARAIQVPAMGESRRASYKQHFGCSVRFDVGVSGVVFSSHWLQRPIAGADPVKQSALQNRLAEARNPMTLGQRAETVLQQMLLCGSATAPGIAALFGISERSMRRRLAAEGTSLRELLNRGRFDLACQMLGYTELAVGDIASALQYRDANAFSRAFRSRAGCTATQWRGQFRR